MSETYLALSEWRDDAEIATPDNVGQGIKWARANARHHGIAGKIMVYSHQGGRHIHWTRHDYDPKHANLTMNVYYWGLP